MHNLRYFCASVSWTLLIALPTTAGEMGFPVGPPPDPNAPIQMAANAPATGSAIMAFAMSILQSVLTLF